MWRTFSRPYSRSLALSLSPSKQRHLLGEPLERVVNTGSLSNPESLEFFLNFAQAKR